MPHCKMIRHWIVVCLCVLTLVSRSHQILEYMTADEVQSVFHTDRHSVSEYEVVPIVHSVLSKDIKNVAVHLKAFGNDINLYLNPTDDILLTESTPVYTVRSNPLHPSGLTYELVSGPPINKRIEMYEDPKSMTMLAMYQSEEGKIQFSGPYGVNFVIRPIPSRLLRIVNTNKKYNDPTFLPDILGQVEDVRVTDHHIIVKYSLKDLLAYSHNLEVTRDAAMKYRNDIASLNFRRFARSLPPTGPPKIAYPELLIIADYDSFKSHGSDIQETIMYYAAFFNAVDLKYRALDRPKVHLHIAAIVVALDREATPYLNKKRISDDTIDATALDDICLHLYEENAFPRGSYDVAIVITASNLCQFPKDSNESSTCPNLRGISKYGSACDWDASTKRVESTALVHDTGFDGIATAAHELAHIFGVPHDGASSLNYVGGPGAKICKWEDGYLMSSSRHNKHALNWSICSEKCFRYFLQKPQAKCLYNIPKSDITLPRVLPGKLLSVDEQCFRATGGKSCWLDESVCTLLWCHIPNSIDECIASTPAAEGSECGVGKICILGQCMRE